MNTKKIYIAFSISFAAILIALIAFGSAIISKLNSAKSDLENSLLRANDKIEQLDRDIRYLETSLRNSLINELEKQNSLFASYKINVGKPDFNTLTAEVSLSVILKEYSDLTTAEFYLGEESAEMVKSGNSFNAAVTVPVTKSYNNASVTVCTDGIYKSEKIKDWIDFKKYFLYNAKSDFDGKISYSDNKISFDGKVRSYFTTDNTNSTINSAHLYVYKNGKEIQKTALTVPQVTVYESGFTFNKSYDVKSSDEITIYLDIKDNYGLTYRLFVTGVKIEDRGFYEFFVSDGYEVFDSLGNKIDFDSI